MTVGAYEAKTHLGELLERVAKGEIITITKRGVPIASLVPAAGVGKQSASDAVARWKRYQAERGITLGEDLNIKEMIEEGRRR